MSQDVAISDYFAAVYKWMGVALAVTAYVAYLVANTPAAINYLMANNTIMFVLIIAQLGLVASLAVWVTRMSYPVAAAVFIGYAALTGVTFSSIFIVYTTSSIFLAFGVAALMYGASSLYGYTTKRDLSGISGFLLMSLIGIIIASVVNFWLSSPLIEWVTTYGGIIVFAGLAAWDHQKLKYYALSGGPQTLAIRGALSLYLDFINLFLLLLRVVGRRR